MKHNALESNTCVRLFDERQDVTLLTALAVNISAPGTYDQPADLTPFSIPAGTVVDSHLLHADSIGTVSPRLQGSVTFDADIIGVIVLQAQLNSTDAKLGWPTTAYPTNFSGRGLELTGPPPAGEDLVTISPDLRTLTFNLHYGSAGMEQIRVITANGPPALSIGDLSLAEGNSGTKLAQLPVRLNYVSGQTVSVAYATADGSAGQPGDYTSSSGSLSFAPGQTLKTVDVAIVGDTANETNETFTVGLSGQTIATLADGSGLATILDDDPLTNCSLTEPTTTIERITPPASVKLGALQSNTCVRLFDERQDLTLGTALTVNISAPGTYDQSTDLTPYSIPAGTVVDSHLLHADNVGTASPRLQGSVTFDTDIIGVMVVAGALNTSDAKVGWPATTYPTNLSVRALELTGPLPAGEDLVTLSPDLRTLTFNVHFGSNGIDEIRVITANGPPTGGSSSFVAGRHAI